MKDSKKVRGMVRPSTRPTALSSFSSVFSINSRNLFFLFLCLFVLTFSMNLMIDGIGNNAVAGENPQKALTQAHKLLDSDDAKDSDLLKGFLTKEQLSPFIVMMALLLAMGLGAIHALSPGHGKGMVAAYLIGSQGRIKDAVFLGGVMTFTHVISVLILGVIALFLSQYILPEKIFPWLGVFSGGLVFLVGYWMLAKKAMQKNSSHHHHSHDHDHGHTHDHSHSKHGHSHAPPKEITWRNLVSLGVAGGMVPCPTALVVLLAAVAVHRIGLGLLMILAFSLGLAAILILIGVLTVSASRLTTRFSEKQSWIQNLPVFSSGVVMVVGISIAFNAVLSAGIITLNL